MDFSGSSNISVDFHENINNSNKLKSHSYNSTSTSDIKEIDPILLETLRILNCIDDKTDNCSLTSRVDNTQDIDIISEVKPDILNNESFNAHLNNSSLEVITNDDFINMDFGLKLKFKDDVDDAYRRVTEYLNPTGNENPSSLKDSHNSSSNTYIHEDNSSCREFETLANASHDFIINSSSKTSREYGSELTLTKEVVNNSVRVENKNPIRDNISSTEVLSDQRIKINNLTVVDEYMVNKKNTQTLSTLYLEECKEQIYETKNDLPKSLIEVGSPLEKNKDNNKIIEIKAVINYELRKAKNKNKDQDDLLDNTPKINCNNTDSLNVDELRYSKNYRENIDSYITDKDYSVETTKKTKGLYCGISDINNYKETSLDKTSSHKSNKLKHDCFIDRSNSSKLELSHMYGNQNELSSTNSELYNSNHVKPHKDSIENRIKVLQSPNNISSSVVATTNSAMKVKSTSKSATLLPSLASSKKVISLGKLVTDKTSNSGLVKGIPQRR